MSQEITLEGYERPLVLHPGDTVVVRHTQRTLSREEAEAVQARFRKYKVEAIVVGCDWEIVREQAPHSLETDRG